MPQDASAPSLFPPLVRYLESVETDWPRLDPERRDRLQRLAGHIRHQHRTARPVRLLFVCTHNSRRSQMSQLWAQAAAAHYGLGGIESYSGGTEATAFHPHAIRAMREAGFFIPDAEGSNPHYRVRCGEASPAMEIFSKTMDDPANPSGDFTAVMTCSEADADCPVVPGASARFSLPYEDPKIADGTVEAEAVYAGRCRQIATELAWVMREVSAAG